MWRIVPFLLLPAGLCAQSQNFDLFEQAPPHIEQALRARVTEFYDLSMEGKFGQIMKTMVADDSLDVYLASDKIKFLSHKIIKIVWSENYTRARVVCDCRFTHFFIGVGSADINMAFTTFWKVVDGQWYWCVEHFDPATGRASPFGNLHRQADPEKNSAGGPSAQALLTKAPTVEQIQNTVRADRTTVELKSDAPSQGEVSLTSNFPGEVTISLDKPDFPGLTLKLDKEKLQSGESAKLKLDYKPVGKSRKADLVARINVEPTRQVVTILIRFSVPATAAAAAQ